MSLYTYAEVENAKALLELLKKYEPELRRRTQLRIRRAAGIILRSARASIPADPPMSGWRTVPAVKGRTRGGAGWPAWETPRKGISARTATRKRIRGYGSRWDLLKIVNRNAIGVIYEFAQQGHSAAGRQFVQNLSDRGGKPGRAIWRSVDLHRDAVAADIRTALADAERELRKVAS